MNQNNSLLDWLPAGENKIKNAIIMSPSEALLVT